MTINLRPIDGKTDIFGNSYANKECSLVNVSLGPFSAVNMDIKLNETHRKIGDLILFFFTYSPKDLIFSPSNTIICFESACYANGSLPESIECVHLESIDYVLPKEISILKQFDSFTPTMVKMDRLIIPFLRKQLQLVNIQDFQDCQRGLNQVTSDLESLTLSLTPNLGLLKDKITFLTETVQGYYNHTFPLKPQQLHNKLYELLNDFSTPLINMIVEYTIPHVKRIGTIKALKSTAKEDLENGIEIVVLE